MECAVFFVWIEKLWQIFEISLYFLEFSANEVALSKDFLVYLTNVLEVRAFIKNYPTHWNKCCFTG